jgi:hypothetical protein
MKEKDIRIKEKGYNDKEIKEKGFFKNCII